jgi:cell division protein FtsQ
MSTVSSRSAQLFAARARARRWATARPLVTTGLVGVLLVGLGWVALGSGVLDVKRVVVVGSSSLSATDVRAAAAGAVGDPMLTVDTDGLQRSIAALPAVARAHVSRTWPGTLRVRVTERTPMLAVRTFNGWRLVDASGIAYTTVPQRPASVLPLVVDRPAPDDASTRAALGVLDALPRRVHRQVAELIAPTPAGVRLRLRGGVIVVWGGPEDARRKARALAVLLERSSAAKAARRPARQYDVSTPGIVTTRS